MSDATPAMNDAAQRARTAVARLFDADRASQALGIEIVDVAPGRVQIAMTVRADMVNGHGMCHGGIVFALADSAFAFACNSHGDPMVAAGASIEFLAPTPRGERHGIYDVAVTNAAGLVLAQFRGRCARLRSGAQ
jgi:acyl-CoA thioesterase